jgi:hypothetical protein
MKRLILFGGLYVLLSMSASAWAQISPGKLSKYHEQLEGIANCTACHELGKELSSAKCLACHSALKARIDAGAGYHSSTDVKGATCASCHSEHNGREFELVHWPQGKDHYDHRLTGYPLEGAHASAGCRNCHKPDFMADVVRSDTRVSTQSSYLGLSAACLNCHAAEHGAQMSNDCASCHTFQSWKPAEKFSHARTKYPLSGKHQQVECAKCHLLEAVTVSDAIHIGKKENVGFAAKYAGLSFSNCTPCHTDPHENKFGANCEGCHTTASFHQIVGQLFDHNKTNFPLTGKHAAVDCAKCHTSGNMTEPVAHARCSDCHRDAHHGQFADRQDKGKCESCHTVDGFVPATYTMDAHQECRYPLTGSHLAVPCFVCHTQVVESKAKSYTRFDFADLTCKGCHKDAHEGQLDKWIAQGGCEFCHGTETWHRTTFDHKLSRFVLEGKHRETPCLSCHTVKKIGTNENVMWMKPVAVECNACHRDPHQGQFIRSDLNETAADCQRCHSPLGWKELKFVHNTDSRYKLDGAHAKVACTECHKTAISADNVQYVIYRPLKMECSDCHATK